MIAWKVVTALALLVATHLALGGDQACPIERAEQAEKALEELHTWEGAIEYFKRYKACLDGGTSEGYTTFLAEQLAADRGIDQFWDATREQIWFRSVLAKRMQSEVISLETTKSILYNLRSQCPLNAKVFCQDLIESIRATCSVCAAVP